MARTAADLALLFDVIAGPDGLTSGVGYRRSAPARSVSATATG